MHILVCNLGSSSLKLSYYKATKQKLDLIWTGFSDLKPSKTLFYLKKQNKIEAQISIQKPLHQAFKELLVFLKPHLSAVDAIGHRLVHGGQKFYQPTHLTPKALKELKKLKELAPLHNPIECLFIEETLKLWPKAFSYAVFDTAYFHKLPEKKRRFALSEKWYKKGIMRYGFHGINHQACAQTLLSQPNFSKKTKIVSCHLGSGCSLSASIGSKCIDTTMGFTPLDGLVMSTRSGSIDPGVIVYLLKHKMCTLKELEHALYFESGLYAFNPNFSNFEKLVHESKQNIKAKLALDIFVDSLSQHIAMMINSLQGCDVLCFSGGIGEKCAYLRKLTIQQLNYLGFKIDPKKNNSNQPSNISSRDSSSSIWVINAQEDQAIAHSLSFFKGLK